MKLEGKITLITGASSGIGMSCAKYFAAEGSNLILLARRSDRIKELAAELARQHGIKILPLACDVRDNDEVEKALRGLPGEWKNIDILINNAGLASGVEKIQDGVLSNWDQMIDTNIKGLLYVSRVVLPGMVERQSGMVINIGSIAGHEVYVGGNVYCGTKHAVKAISKGMLLDLNGSGIRVTSIDPGAVETEFSLVRFHGDKQSADNVYKGFKPLGPDDIADIALFAATRPPHVDIHDVIVAPTAQASTSVFAKKL